jgi:hypothetical protein
MSSARNWLRAGKHETLRALMRMAGWLAGAGCMAGLTACYGPPSLPPPHDPTVVLLDFSYTPASPVRVGDTLTLHATLNHTTHAGWMSAVFKNFKFVSVDLLDDGLPPDDLADDGVYSGRITWGPELGNGKGLRVFAELQWFDDYEGQTRDAPPLTVLPAEEGGQ